MRTVLQFILQLPFQDRTGQEPPDSSAAEALQQTFDEMLSISETDNPLTAIVIRIAIAIGVLLLAAVLANLVKRTVRRLLERTKLMPSMVKLFSSLAYFGVWGAAILTALAMLGIPIAGIAAALGAVSLVLGLALQESIGNFAATVNFMLFEPFKVGDLIESGDTMGVVTEIQPLTTVITKYDKKVVTVPNARLMADKIINYSQMGILRVDQLFQISYSDDLEHALEVLREVVAAEPRILTDPAPIINVRELGDNGITLNCLVHTKFDDYWSTQADLRKTVKLRFDQEGITIPFPQQTLHLADGPSNGGKGVVEVFGVEEEDAE